MNRKKTECSPLYRITSEQQFTYGRYKRPLFKYFPSDFVSSYCSEVFDISRFLAAATAPIAFVECRAYTVDSVPHPPCRSPTRLRRLSAHRLVCWRVIVGSSPAPPKSSYYNARAITHRRRRRRPNTPHHPSVYATLGHLVNDRKKKRMGK